jgi:hypothetical protein
MSEMHLSTGKKPYDLGMGLGMGPLEGMVVCGTIGPSWHRTTDRKKVTCKRCLAIMAKSGKKR